ncbi:MAG: hypothetical protein ACRELV_02060 [Longimicrobiales bacterium]
MADAKHDVGAEEQWTCGNGLAQHSVIPAKMAELLRSLAENLEAHVPTIDATDDNGRQERDAYVQLHSDYASIAGRLAATADLMRRYRDLPAAGHDEEALSDPKLLEAFETFVSLENELADLLRTSADRDQSLLRQV